MRYVKISAKVERRIEELRQSGKTGKSIAQKAYSIIESLKSGAFLDQNEYIGPVTKYGEKRLKGCRKYDFGRGYRLITLQKEMMILVPFLGTHDECDKWLEKNNRSKHIAEGKGTMVSVPETAGRYCIQRMFPVMKRMICAWMKSPWNLMNRFYALFFAGS
jgi:hypothetical protein